MKEINKRIFDIILSSVLLLIFSFPILFLSFYLFFKYKENPFFYQERIGKDNKKFIIFKLKIKVFSKEKKEFILTSVGRFLDIYKINELPQLFNIVIGNMSFVGPRPELPEVINLLSESEKQKILSVKPGLTSKASLKYFNEQKILASKSNPKEFYYTVIWPDKVNMNIEYSQNWTLQTDLKILFNTFLKFIKN